MLNDSTRECFYYDYCCYNMMCIPLLVFFFFLLCFIDDNEVSEYLILMAASEYHFAGQLNITWPILLICEGES